MQRFGEAHDVRLILASAELRRLGAHYRQLRGDIDLVPEIAGDDVVLTGEDLRMYQVLAGCGEDLAVTFVRETLGSILSLPPTQRDPLIATLVAFQDGGGTIAQAAARLNLSPKGVAYRRRRITELTGLSTSDRADRFRLQLATYLLRIYPSPSGLEDVR